MDKHDHLRFLETIDFYRKIPTPSKLSDFRRGVKKITNDSPPTKELIKIYCYCLMPNHYHFLVQEKSDGGITKFTSQLANSYTKYFNTKYKRVGPLFQGAFKARLIDNEEYLLHLSRYVHRNPISLFPPGRWESKFYPYSSYEHYLNGKGHEFCDISFILSYFSKTNPQLTYQSFVESKEFPDASFYSFLIDPDD